VKRVLCLVGLVFILSSCTSTYHQKASKYEMNKEYVKAIEIYDKLIQMDVEMLYYVYYRRGLAYQQLGKTDKAIADFGKSIRLNSRFGYNYLSRAHVYESLAQWSKAAADYGKALSTSVAAEMGRGSYASSPATSSARAFSRKQKGKFSRSRIDTIPVESKDLLAIHASKPPGRVAALRFLQTAGCESRASEPPLHFPRHRRRIRFLQAHSLPCPVCGCKKRDRV
jgi:uncharacterized protein YxeA